MPISYKDIGPVDELQQQVDDLENFLAVNTGPTGPIGPQGIQGSFSELFLIKSATNFIRTQRIIAQSTLRGQA